MLGGAATSSADGALLLPTQARIHRLRGRGAAIPSDSSSVGGTIDAGMREDGIDFFAERVLWHDAHSVNVGSRHDGRTEGSRLSSACGASIPLRSLRIGTK